MKDFEKLVLKTKKVSIWGIGYLGYTTILRLQDSGFTANVYDFSEDRLSNLVIRSYPSKDQLNTWSKSGKIPLIDLEKIDIAYETKALFDNKVHIISFPETQVVNYSDLAKIFLENKESLKDSLIIFQSAGVPTSIEKNFCKILIDEGINLDIVTLFRSDWIIEDFLLKNTQRILSSNNNNALKKAQSFLKVLNLKHIVLSNIEEAEVYENSKIALNHTIVGFFNQLSLAYPHININELAFNTVNSLDFSNFSLGLSSVDYKSEQSCENIMRGSKGDFLSILKEANNTNIAFLFFYVDLLKSKNVESVTIFGISSYNSMKDYRFSPSVILAESLIKEKIKVAIHDENIEVDELKEILPECDYLDIENEPITTDSVIIMSMCPKYRFLTQEGIENIKLTNVKYIIDNTGFFKQFTFSSDSIYHQLCDDQLIKVMS